MKFNIPKLEIRTFYLTGAILMVFSIIGSIWALNTNWSHLVYGARMSSIVGVLFNALWMGLFAFLYKMTPKGTGIPQKVVNSPEIEQMLKEMSLSDKKEVQ